MSLEKVAWNVSRRNSRIFSKSILFGFCFCLSLIRSKGLSTVKEKNFKLFVTVQQQIFDTDFSNSVAKAVIIACDVISFLFCYYILDQFASKWWERRNLILLSLENGK